MKAYYGITITLVDNSPHNLLQRLQLIDPTVPAFCRLLSIQNDPANVGHNLLIGDDAIDIGPGASTRGGAALQAGQIREYGATDQSLIPLANIWLADESGSNTPENIEIVV